MFSKEELNQFYRYCLALTGEEAAAHDLLQDSLEKYLRKKSPVKSSRAYFRRMIRNLFIDQYRQSSKREIIGLDENIIPVTDNGLESLVVNAEETQIILKELNHKDRELLYLWAVEEYTAKELADLLKCPRGTVLSRLHRLKIKIIGFLGRKEIREIKYERTIKTANP